MYAMVCGNVMRNAAHRHTVLHYSTTCVARTSLAEFTLAADSCGVCKAVLSVSGAFEHVDVFVSSLPAAVLRLYPIILDLGGLVRAPGRRLLHKAVDATDPVERLRWVATWFTAGLQHVFQSWKKPFNPILGETWQVRRAVLPSAQATALTPWL